MHRLARRRPLEVLAQALGGATERLPLTAWASQGYKGWALGSASFAHRPDGCMLVMTGEQARNPGGIPYRDDARCTRLDIKLDVWYPDPKPYIINKVVAMSAMAQVGRPGKPWQILPYQPIHGGGHSVQLGRRGKRLFIRVYDKEAQSREERYKGCWRFECELAKEEANVVFHWLDRRGWRDHDVRLRALAYLSDRGIAFDGGLPGQRQVPCSGTPDRDPLEKRLDWLVRCVRPAVRDMLQHVDTGTILLALGLTDEDFIDQEA